MLVKLRKIAGTWIMAIFSFLIIISFAIWGIGDIFRGRTSNTVADVGDIEISANQLSREFRREVRRLGGLFGGQLDSERARELGVDARALDSLIARALYDLETTRLGLVIGDDHIKREIFADSGFHNAQGAFDTNIFASVLASTGLSEPEYIALLRNDLKASQLDGSMAAPVAAPKFLVRSIYRHREQRRIAEFFVVTHDSVGSVPEPDDGALAAFHQQNAVRFTAPEYRRLTFIRIEPEDLLGEIVVSEEEIEVEYQDRRASFVQAERRTVDQILLPDEETAKQAHTRLVGGHDFMAVAREVAGMRDDDISLGTVSRGEMFGEIADTVFALPSGEISPPVKSPFGWHIFRVTEIEPEVVRPLAEVRAELEREIALSKAADPLYQLTNALDDVLGGGGTLAEAAASLKLRLGRVGAVDARGSAPGGAAAEGLPDAPEFLSTAFATRDGETSLLVESGDGSSFVVRVDGVTPPTLKPLAGIRDQVAEAWRETELDKAAAARAVEMAERVNGGGDLASAAGELGLTAATSEAVRRDGDGADSAFSRQVVTGLFSLDVGKAFSAPARGPRGYVVARLTEIVKAPQPDDAKLTDLRNELRATMTDDLRSQYRATLEARFPVRVNRGAINALF